MGYKEQLVQIEKDMGEKKIEKAKLEERMARLKDDRKLVVEELGKHNLTEAQVDEWLLKEEAELKKGIEECQKILSGV